MRFYEDVTILFHEESLTGLRCDSVKMSYDLHARHPAD